MVKFPCCALLLLASGFGQDTPTPDAAVIQDFQNRVGGYMKLHEAVKSGLPKLKTTPSSGSIERHEKQFAHKIREARLNAQQGNIFTPPITTEFRRLIANAMKGNATHVTQSLKSAEPVQLKLHVNHSYPDGVPLQSMPPTLLFYLPKLPQDLDYRVIGHDLVLRDASGNLVVDLIPNALP